MQELKWYVMYTRSRAEKKVADMLVEEGIEVYLPMVEELRQWSDRKKKVQKALFNGYVFVKTHRNNLWNCLKVPGAVKFVHFSGEYRQTGKAARLAASKRRVFVDKVGRMAIFLQGFGRGRRVLAGGAIVEVSADEHRGGAWQMRLTIEQQNQIKQTVTAMVDGPVEIYVFGSRVDDARRGGDIDIMVKTPVEVAEPAMLMARISARLHILFGGIKVDVLLHAPSLLIQPIHRVALREGVKL